MTKVVWILNKQAICVVWIDIFNATSAMLVVERQKKNRSVQQICQQNWMALAFCGPSIKMQYVATQFL